MICKPAASIQYDGLASLRAWLSGCLTELGKPVPGDRSLTVAAL
jgi:hypothetical protein